VKDGMWTGLRLFLWLHLTNNQINFTPLSSKIFPRFLTNLDLHGNKITTIPSQLFKNVIIQYALDMSGNEITSLNSGIFAAGPVIPRLINTVHMRLQDNKIATIEDDVFEPLKLLWEINLGNNKLTRITNGMFNKADNLGLLNLHGNEITVMEDGAFTNKTRLRTIYLNKNKLTSINDELFQDLNSLRILNLQENNINTISADALATTDALYELNLAKNNLASLPKKLFKTAKGILALWLQSNALTDSAWEAIKSLSVLDSVDLSLNKLSSVPKEMFLDKPKASMVILTDNDISEVGVNAFGSHKRLDLDHNVIITLKESSFILDKKPAILNLNDNPLECTCDIRWLVDAEFVSDDAQCDGTPLSAIDATKLQCKNVNIVFASFSATQDTINVTWTVNDDTYIDEYVLEWYEYPNDNKASALVSDPGARSYLITGLIKETIYTVCVTANTNAGDAFPDPQECVYMSTTVMTPDPEVDAITLIVAVGSTIGGLLLIQLVAYFACCYKSEEEEDDGIK
ncbi:PREDICTED: insulin-like growth factor-binding protein complex acid labile subunit, partial [Priapulus caudatus]|uniref:Insulin-like growth factor-binding protein complex acid labile subunit n=1 Tax=Priapulus caudatus TaxID=37621 RepID=A0ABM1E236_PRICU